MQSTGLTGRTILIAEDEPLIALDIRNAFENAGAVVVTARTLAQAECLIERECLSAAVMDFGLADGDAEETCARLEARDIPYVLHSGYSDRRTPGGRGVVIPKPNNPAKLIDAVVELLRRPPQ